MLKQHKTFSDYFGKDNLNAIKQNLEVLLSSPGGGVMIILPPTQNNPRPKIIDAYFNIHANCVRGIVDTSLKDAVKAGLLIDGFPIKFYIGKNHHKDNSQVCKKRGNACLTGVKTH